MHERRKLTGLLPGKLLVRRTSRHLSGRAIDVSPQGMGILSSMALEEGELVDLNTASQKIPLRVIDKKRDYAKCNRYRYSLVICEGAKTPEGSVEVNLEEIFKGSGCLN